MSFRVGDRVGDYEVIAVLGGGGMGQVYQVQNLISRRVEAMKVLLPDLEANAEATERFMREIRVLADLDHPNIAKLYNAQWIDNRLLMIMEFVEGTTLAENRKSGLVSLEDGLRYIGHVLSALGYAHQRGVVHRDVKPANIMITPDSTLKLMDFGIAKVASERKLTRTGTTLGSVYYMSPEQVQGEPDALDGRSDLYSVGVVLYEIATGRRPFECGSDFAIMAAHLQTVPVPPRDVNAELPSGLNDAILRALAKDPAQRYQTAEEFQKELESVSPRFAERADSNASSRPSNHADHPLARESSHSNRHHRMWYMLLGSLAAMLALIIATAVIAKFTRARATGTAGVSTQRPNVAREREQPEHPVEISGSGAVSYPEQATGGAGGTRDTNKVQGQATAQVEPGRVAKNQGNRARPPSRSNETLIRATRAPAAPAARSAADDRTLQKLKDRLIHLGARAKAMEEYWEGMQNQQKSEGSGGLRPGIAEALNLVDSYSHEANSWLAAGNAEQTSHYADLLEEKVKYLEGLSGR